VLNHYRLRDEYMKTTSENSSADSQNSTQDETAGKGRFSPSDLQLTSAIKGSPDWQEGMMARYVVTFAFYDVASGGLSTPRYEFLEAPSREAAGALADVMVRCEVSNRIGVASETLPSGEKEMEEEGVFYRFRVTPLIDFLRDAGLPPQERRALKQTAERAALGELKAVRQSGRA
jgi:hypothetical protein